MDLYLLLINNQNPNKIISHIDMKGKNCIMFPLYLYTLIHHIYPIPLYLYTHIHPIYPTPFTKQDHYGTLKDLFFSIWIH
jgi:hypothetical protein